MKSQLKPPFDPVTKVVIACCRHDVHLTRICVASIRYWYPEIPIFLLKDLFHGDFPTAEIEAAWRVGIFPTTRDQHGWGFGKFEAIFAPPGDRLLVLDADTAILGRVIDLIETSDADLVVSGDFVADQSSGYVKHVYYDVDQMRHLYPGFAYPGFCFNSGHFAIRTGKLHREDFAGLVEWSIPPRLLEAAKCFDGDQGILNFVAARNVQQRKLTIAPMQFARGGEDPGLAHLPLDYIQRGQGYPYIIHWAGLKPVSISLMPRSDILSFYEGFYYTRVPRGYWTRSQRALLHPVTAFTSNLHSTALRTRLRRTLGQQFRRVARSGVIRRLLANDRIYHAITGVGSAKGGTVNGRAPNRSGAARATTAGFAELGRRAGVARRLLRKVAQPASVKAGLFAGMRYPFVDPARPNLFPKILGTYASELHFHLSPISGSPLPVICDVGCGDGYLAIGLAKKQGSVSIHAFDLDPTARRDCWMLAEANGVAEHLRVDECCGPGVLLEMDFARGGLVRFGGDGIAKGLLTPELGKHLLRAHLLIELWRLPDRRLADDLIGRLGGSHELIAVESRENGGRALEYRSSLVNSLDPLEQEIAFSESRPGDVLWLIANPRT
jgi:hypothetical protein